MEEEQKNESDEKREGNYYIIHSDSQYAVFSVTVWCYKWKDNGWKDFSGATIKYGNLWWNYLRNTKN